MSRYQMSSSNSDYNNPNYNNSDYNSSNYNRSQMEEGYQPNYISRRDTTRQFINGYPTVARSPTNVNVPPITPQQSPSSSPSFSSSSSYRRRVNPSLTTVNESSSELLPSSSSSSLSSSYRRRVNPSLTTITESANEPLPYLSSSSYRKRTVTPLSGSSSSYRGRTSPSLTTINETSDELTNDMTYGVATETPFVAAEQGGEQPIRGKPINYNRIPILGETEFDELRTSRASGRQSLYTNTREQRNQYVSQRHPKFEQPTYTVNDITLPELISELVNLLLSLEPYYSLRERVFKPVTTVSNSIGDNQVGLETEAGYGQAYPSDFNNYNLESFIYNILLFVPYYIHNYPRVANSIISLANQILEYYYQKQQGGKFKAYYISLYYNVFMKEFSHLSVADREDIYKNYKLNWHL
jgi:hypothetical protein